MTRPQKESHGSETPDAPGLEADLVQRTRSGDQGAFRELVHLFTPRVYAVVRNLVHHPVEAEDVTQEVFFKVYRKIDSFREDSSFYTWLYRVAVNAATDWIKKRRQDRATLVEDWDRVPVADPTDGPETGLVRRDLRTEIRSAMAELPEKFRTILVLRELEGLSYEEIGEVLDLHKGTVESRLFRARARLKEALDRRDLGAL